MNRREEKLVAWGIEVAAVIGPDAVRELHRAHDALESEGEVCAANREGLGCCIQYLPVPDEDQADVGS